MRSLKLAPGSGKVIRRILSHIKKYRSLVILSFALALVSVTLTLFIPVLIGQAVDEIVGAGNVDFTALREKLLLLAGCAVIAGCAQWLMNHINNKLTYHMAEDLRVQAFNKMEVLPFSYLDVRPQGDIVNRIISDTDQFADGILMGFTQFFSGVITIIGTLLIMLSIDPLISLAVVVLTPLSFFVAGFVSKRSYSMFYKRSETAGRLSALSNEMIDKLKLVQAFGYEDTARERFFEINSELERYYRTATFYSSITNPSTRFINALVYAVVGVFGAISAMNGMMTVGSLTSFLSYASQYAKPFNEISGVVTELQNALASAGRIFEIIDADAPAYDRGGATAMEDVRGEVSFKDVSFSYTRGTSLIEDLNLDVRPGQRVAIVGPTGAGKSTLINLLMRFYDPVSGHISLDGRDSRDILIHSLREGFGMVLQETWLKSGTIRDNIAYADPEASDEEVRRAAHEAYADIFIERMKDGYDTVISEDGGSLSQGQKQLLCIARIMLRLPPMLILDEATSSIDTMTEQRVQKAFAKMMEGRTSFIVAHRLSTIREADVILVMKDGHIIEQGSHDELMSRQGFYHELYMSQFETA